MISLDPSAPQGTETQRPRSITFVVLLIAAFAVLAAIYGFLIATAVLPFNAGAWVVGEDIASRGWLGYILLAVVHFTAALGLWRQWRWARWLTIFLLAIGLLPAVPGISAAVVDLRISGIALWGTLIILRTAALYAMFNAE